MKSVSSEFDEKEFKIKVTVGEHSKRVFVTANKYDDSIKVIVKVFEREAFKYNQIQEEISILRKLDHPNIVKYFETYDETEAKHIYAVMELVEGEFLKNQIIDRENNIFSEKEAAGYMQTLFQAINHCHALGIMHKDIRLEKIKITD